MWIGIWCDAFVVCMLCERSPEGFRLSPSSYCSVFIVIVPSFRSLIILNFYAQNLLRLLLPLITIFDSTRIINKEQKCSKVGGLIRFHSSSFLLLYVVCASMCRLPLVNMRLASLQFPPKPLSCQKVTRRSRRRQSRKNVHRWVNAAILIALWRLDGKKVWRLKSQTGMEEDGKIRAWEQMSWQMNFRVERDLSRYAFNEITSTSSSDHLSILSLARSPINKADHYTNLLVGCARVDWIKISEMGDVVGYLSSASNTTVTVTTRN